MIKIILLTTTLFFTGCLNKHGVSAQYYSGCKEYYDLQGYYHKECGEDDIITYEEAETKTKRSIAKIKNKIKKTFGQEVSKPKPIPNVE
ncbi:MAG: hypothetical protein Q9M32_03030 [Sulfurimonas sp.]|nr:hypothetical protein [Sulfurimonas sp.]MDQ7059675.1 hypothetical protein [Sulfurimonas sp.]